MRLVGGAWREGGVGVNPDANPRRVNGARRVGGLADSDGERAFGADGGKRCWLGFINQFLGDLTVGSVDFDESTPGFSTRLDWGYSCHGHVDIQIAAGPHDGH